MRETEAPAKSESSPANGYSLTLRPARLSSTLHRLREGTGGARPWGSPGEHVFLNRTHTRTCACARGGQMEPIGRGDPDRRQAQRRGGGAGREAAVPAGGVLPDGARRGGFRQGRPGKRPGAEPGLRPAAGSAGTEAVRVRGASGAPHGGAGACSLEGDRGPGRPSSGDDGPAGIRALQGRSGGFARPGGGIPGFGGQPYRIVNREGVGRVAAVTPPLRSINTWVPTTLAYANHKCQIEIGPGLFAGRWLPYTKARPCRVYARSEAPDPTGTGGASTR